MLFLLRLLAILLFIGYVCRFFYTLGKKTAQDEQNKKQSTQSNRKPVDSVVIDEEIKEKQ